MIMRISERGTKSAPITHACPACGELVECGMSNGDERCWCFDLPHALPISEEGSPELCYCAGCLTKRIADLTRLPSRGCNAADKE
jgi:Cysteine-rich CWC